MEKNLGIILAHHGIVPSTKGLNPLEIERHVSQENFKLQLQWLQDHDFEFVSLSQLVSELEANELHGRKATVTFDDGLFNVSEHALPILREFKAQACIFLTGKSTLDGTLQWTDVVEQWWQKSKPQGDWQGLREFKRGLRRCSLAERDKILAEIQIEAPITNLGLARTLNIGDVLALGSDIFEFGCHSMTHPSLYQLQDPKVLFEEIYNAKAQLEAALGQKMRHYAYPFGEFDSKLKESIKSAGFASALTMVPQWLSGNPDVFELGRMT